MRRGTTPTIHCELPTLASTFSHIDVYFAQNDDIVLTLSKSNLVCEGNDISFTLTENQTKSFAEGIPAKIQIRLQTPDGKVLLSDIRYITVRERLADLI